jgi:4-amino-4-deoxy-L-arabinose transferase-like glycosyltransferase
MRPELPTINASRTLNAVLIAAAVAPWIPDILAFIREGVPDPVYAGDAAALEFGVFHALHGDQLLGPYSRFGWSHPGPAMFYLAAPFYAAFGQHSAALRLFAFVVNMVSALAIVHSVRLLNGRLAGLIAAAFIAVFTTVARPFLPTNVWNPILPMLPLALTFCLAARIARGEARLLPIFAVLASAAVQTHVAYGPAILGLWVSAMILRRGTVSRTRWLTLFVLLCLL